MLTYIELAARWSVSVHTLRHWVMLGRIQPVRLGRVVRFRESDVHEWEREGF